jgi:Zn-dependent protease with chaperone function
MGVLMLVVLYMSTGLPKGRWLAAIPLGLLVLLPVGTIVGTWLQLRASRRPLPPGDPVYELVHEVAAAAGVRVRHVARVLSPVPNAYATLLGTVGLSAGLLRSLEPDEIRAVVAHEIGHLRCGHVRRGFLLGALFTVLVCAAWWFGTGWFEGRVSRGTFALLRSPFATIFLMPILRGLILGRGQRKREEEADRFAVEVTGDPELVIRALTRIHTLAAAPHRLKPSDEAISTHPALVHRIEAIRRLRPGANHG